MEGRNIKKYYSIFTLFLLIISVIFSVFPNSTISAGTDYDGDSPPWANQKLSLLSADVIGADGKETLYRSTALQDPYCAVVPEATWKETRGHYATPDTCWDSIYSIRYATERVFGKSDMITDYYIYYPKSYYQYKDTDQKMFYAIIYKIKGNGDDVGKFYLLNALANKDGSPTLTHPGWYFSDNVNPLTVDLNGIDPLKGTIRSGVIWGKLIPSGDWSKVGIKDVFDDTVYKHLVLYKDGSQWFEPRSTDGREAEADGSVRYNGWTINASQTLVPGKYELRASADDSWENCGGENEIGFCTVEYRGSTFFEIDNNGKLIITKTDDPGSQQYIRNSYDVPADDVEPPINVVVGIKISSPLDGIMENAMATVLSSISKGIKIIGGYINGILNSGNNINNAKLGDVWTRVRNLSLGLLTLGILIIAFANILSIDIEKYGLNRMIPKLVIAIVMTYFSFIIARFLLEVASALQNLALSGTTPDMANLGGGNFNALFNGDIGAYANSIGLLIVLFLLGFIFMIVMIVLCFVLLVRQAVIWFLVAVSPLAFMMMIMPFTEKLYQGWWSKFWKWAFMGPAIAFMLYMTDTFLRAGFGVLSSDGATTASMGNPDTWVFLMMATAGVFISASLPFTMGGDVYGAIQKGIQKYGKHVPGVKQAKARLDLRRGSKESNMKLQAMKAQARLASRGGLPGRILAGTTKTQAKMLDENLVTATGQEMGMTNLDEKVLAPLLNNRSGNVARAAGRELAKRKRLGAALDSMEDPDEASKAATRLSLLMKRDGGLNTAVRADNKDAFASMYNRTGDEAIKADAVKGVTSVPLKDIKGHQIKLIQKLSTEATKAGKPALSRSYNNIISSQLNDENARAGFMKDADSGVKAAIGQMMVEDAAFATSVPRDVATSLGESYRTFVDTSGKKPLD